MRSLQAVCLLAFLSTVACGGGGSPGGAAPTGGGAPAATLSLLVGDAPVSSLSSLQVGMRSVRMVRSDGTSGDELLVAPVVRDLLALRTVSELVGIRSLPVDTYTALEIEIEAASIVARDLTGNVVPVQVNGTRITAALGAPLTVRDAEHVKLRIDVDLDASLSAAAAGLVFAGRALGERRSGSEPLDEIHGVIVSAAPPARELTVDVVERQSGAVTGRLVVRLATSARLLDDDEQPFASEAAFFAAAVPGVGIEADGALEDDGTFTATVVELDDRSEGVATIKGTILTVDPGRAALSLRIREVREGGALVGPVLAALGQPAAIDVAFGNATIGVRGAAPRPGTAADLVAGAEVEVELAAFASEPFPAREIEIEGGVEYEGTVTDVSGLPAAFTLRLEPHDPAARSGRVTAPVRVDLDGSERIYLKLGHEPAVTQRALFAGVRVRVRGALAGPATAATLAAEDIRVRPGRLQGTAVGVNASPAAVAIDWDDLDDPFGTAAPPDPVMAGLAAGARVTGDVRSFAELLAAWSRAGTAGRIGLRAFGTDDGAGGIEVHELRVDLP